MAAEDTVGMPQDLDIESGYTLRVTALDSTGAVVAGAKVGTVVFTANAVNVVTDSSGQIYGQWFLVPGPNA